MQSETEGSEQTRECSAEGSLCSLSFLLFGVIEDRDSMTEVRFFFSGLLYITLYYLIKMYHYKIKLFSFSVFKWFCVAYSLLHIEEFP